MMEKSKQNPPYRKETSMIESVSMGIGLLKFTLEQFLEPLALSSETGLVK